MQALETSMGGTLKVEEDLMEFCNLSEGAVRHLVMRWTQGARFTDEFHDTPEILRKSAQGQSDHWFYLSSKYYMFGNAMHRYLPACGLMEPEVFQELVPAGAKVLDYAGGTGNALFATQALGYEVYFRELSALQIEFVRFRAHKYKIPMTFFDWWEELPKEYFDAVCFDSIGHVEDQKADLTRMVGTLKKGGLLFLDVEDFDSVCYGDGDDRRYTPPVPDPSKCQSMHRPPQVVVDELMTALGCKVVKVASRFLSVWVKV